MTIPSCDPSVLVDYLEDQLSPQKETVVEEHLTDCKECRSRISAAAGSGDDWTNITGALRVDEFDSPATDNPPQPLWPLKLLGPTDDPHMLGRIGPFEVSGCVGVGGMGVVFKARDPALDRFVAVKVLAPHLAASRTARARFAREAKAAAAVVHDNVIALHQVSEYQGLPYLVMPYLPGPSLEHRLQRKGKLAPVEALRIARQVAAGLSAAHEQGLIHRDIKPANIMLSGDTERAVITDFGLARAADDATLTQSGTLAGTPQYMAPEQARGDHTDAQSDLFSLGSVLFAMLTGEPPVPLLSGSETIRRVSQEAPPRIEDRLANVPNALQEAVGRLHCFDPKNRASSAAEADKLLKAAMANPNTEPLKDAEERRTIMAWKMKAILVVAILAISVSPVVLLSLTSDNKAEPLTPKIIVKQIAKVVDSTAAEEAVEGAKDAAGLEAISGNSSYAPLRAPVDSPARLSKPTWFRKSKSNSASSESGKVISREPPTGSTDLATSPNVRLQSIVDLETAELDSLLNDLEHRLEQLENR